MVCGRLGAELVLLDLKPVDHVQERLEISGVRSSSYALDISDRTEVESVVKKAGSVDGLVLAAAIALMNDWFDFPDWDDDFHRTMDVNFLSCVHLCRAWLPGMYEKGHGAIVVVGSAAGHNGGTALTNQPHYVGSKAAAHAFVRWLSRRVVTRGINVNGVAPGPTKTGMNANIRGTPALDYSGLPMKRIAEPEEIAWPIAFLCSPAASYMSGAIVDVNGGTFVG
jgi:NAD(P)-dependent dehydrogenase (short-subunit alcohol dehydrogenase family)